MRYYIYEYYQKYNSDGTPVRPEEFMKGRLIGVAEYDSKADCEDDIIWELVEDEYICIEDDE